MKPNEMGDEVKDRPTAQRMPPVSILAGGRSRRMGADKALVDFQGEPLVRRVVDRALAVAARVSLVLHRAQLADQRYRGLAEQTGVRLLADDYDHCGPLGGLSTALRHHADWPAVLVLSCDMPCLTTELLEILALRHAASAAEATIAMTADGVRQPLPGVYATSLIKVVSGLIAADQLRFDQLFGLVRTTIIPYDDPSNPRLFANLNTRDELDEAAGPG